MQEVQASDVAKDLPRLLDEVERGETVTITRDGRAIAKLIPDDGRRPEGVDRAIESIRSLRKRVGRLTVEEIVSTKNEGRR